LQGHQILPIAFIIPSAFLGLYEKSFPTTCISPPEPPPFYLHEPFITELSAFDSFKPHSNLPNSTLAPLLCAMDATRNPPSSFLATEIGGKDGWMNRRDVDEHESEFGLGNLRLLVDKPTRSPRIWSGSRDRSKMPKLHGKLRDQSPFPDFVWLHMVKVMNTRVARQEIVATRSMFFLETGNCDNGFYSYFLLDMVHIFRHEQRSQKSE